MKSLNVMSNAKVLVTKDGWTDKRKTASQPTKQMNIADYVKGQNSSLEVHWAHCPD